MSDTENAERTSKKTKSKKNLETKICMSIPTNPGCGEEKLLEYFYETPKGSGKYRKTCKKCIAKQRKIDKDIIKQLLNKDKEVKSDSEEETQTSSPKKVELTKENLKKNKI